MREIKPELHSYFCSGTLMEIMFSLQFLLSLMVVSWWKKMLEKWYVEAVVRPTSMST